MRCRANRQKWTTAKQRMTMRCNVLFVTENIAFSHLPIGTFRKLNSFCFWVAHEKYFTHSSDEHVQSHIDGRLMPNVSLWLRRFQFDRKFTIEFSHNAFQSPSDTHSRVVRVTHSSTDVRIWLAHAWFLNENVHLLTSINYAGCCHCLLLQKHSESLVLCVPRGRSGQME